MKAVCIFLAIACAAFGHDIPNDVTVQAVLKPSGNRLQLLVRAPLAVLRDINFPERPNGTLDLARVEPFLREGASLWIADAVEMYEDDTRLPKPRITEVHLSVISDKSFARIPENTNVFWNQTLLNVLFE